MSFFKDIFRKRRNKQEPIYKTYIPTPLNQNPINGKTNTQANPQYCETEANLDRIGNMGIAFGSEKTTQVFENNAKNIVQNHSHIIGSKKMVSDISKIEGVCSICEEISMRLAQKNAISLQEAQLLSLYDKSSAAQCDCCGGGFCSRHCRPVQISESLVQMLCLNCQKVLARQVKKQRIKRFLSLLLLPFLEDETEL